MMGSLIERLRIALSGFLQGRNGPDDLARSSVIAGFVLTLVDMFIGTGVVSMLGTVAVVYGVFRMFSCNIAARSRENERFTAWLDRVKDRLRGFKDRTARSKETKYFKCARCKQRLSVPRGKGKLKVTCPKCGESKIIRS